MMVVPTLDVDLAWHTHQLNPRSYYDTTTRILDKFMDHDDKVDENKLSMSFEWMCETWYKKYAEIYSECVCWYCEGMYISAHLSPIKNFTFVGVLWDLTFVLQLSARHKQTL